MTNKLENHIDDGYSAHNQWPPSSRWRLWAPRSVANMIKSWRSPNVREGR